MREPSSVTINQDRADSNDAQHLIALLDADLESAYPSATIHRLHPEDLEPGRLFFLIARIDGKPVACGALRPLEAELVEVKRMYVVPEFRRRGLARKILAALEAEALKRGFKTIRLETGNRQPEPLALYRSSGYYDIPPYGEYIGNPLSVCLEKKLSS